MKSISYDALYGRLSVALALLNIKGIKVDRTTWREVIAAVMRRNSKIDLFKFCRNRREFIMKNRGNGEFIRLNSQQLFIANMLDSLARYSSQQPAAYKTNGNSAYQFLGNKLYGRIRSKILPSSNFKVSNEAEFNEILERLKAVPDFLYEDKRGFWINTAKEIPYVNQQHRKKSKKNKEADMDSNAQPKLFGEEFNNILIITRQNFIHNPRFNHLLKYLENLYQNGPQPMKGFGASLPLYDIFNKFIKQRGQPFNMFQHQCDGYQNRPELLRMMLALCFYCAGLDIKYPANLYRYLDQLAMADGFVLEKARLYAAKGNFDKMNIPKFKLPDGYQKKIAEISGLAQVAVTGQGIKSFEDKKDARESTEMPANKDLQLRSINNGGAMDKIRKVTAISYPVCSLTVMYAKTQPGLPGITVNKLSYRKISVKDARKYAEENAANFFGLRLGKKGDPWPGNPQKTRSMDQFDQVLYQTAPDIPDFMLNKEAGRGEKWICTDLVFKLKDSSVKTGKAKTDGKFLNIQMANDETKADLAPDEIIEKKPDSDTDKAQIPPMHAEKTLDVSQLIKNGDDEQLFILGAQIMTGLSSRLLLVKAPDKKKNARELAKDVNSMFNRFVDLAGDVPADSI